MSGFAASLEAIPYQYQQHPITQQQLGPTMPLMLPFFLLFHSPLSLLTDFIGPITSFQTLSFDNQDVVSDPGTHV
jgi:hypothetical protein